MKDSIFSDKETLCDASLVEESSSDSAPPNRPMISTEKDSFDEAIEAFTKGKTGSNKDNSTSSELDDFDCTIRPLSVSTSGQTSNQPASVLSVLEDCAPDPTLEEGTPPPIEMIRKPHRDIPFTFTGDRLELSCIIERTEDEGGKFAGESFHPVKASVQKGIFPKPRKVRFLGCREVNGGYFILPLKLSTPSSRPNTWLASMEEIAQQDPGTWLNVWSDSESQMYRFEPVDSHSTDSIEWPEFPKELETALGSNIIDHVGHPVLARVAQSRKKSSNWGDF